MNKNKGQAITQIHFGQFKTEIKPSSKFKNQDQALDAMLIAVHTSALAWIVDNTLDPESQGGKQETLKADVKDGQEAIAQIIIEVPTTQNFSKVMYEKLLQDTLVPAAKRAFQQYPSTRSAQPGSAQRSQNPLAETIVPDALQQVSKVRPQQLQIR
jgi:hypothetical protein